MRTENQKTAQILQQWNLFQMRNLRVICHWSISDCDWTVKYIDKRMKGGYRASCGVSHTLEVDTVYNDLHLFIFAENW